MLACNKGDESAEGNRLSLTLRKHPVAATKIKHRTRRPGLQPLPHTPSHWPNAVLARKQSMIYHRMYVFLMSF